MRHRPDLPHAAASPQIIAEMPGTLPALSRSLYMFYISGFVFVGGGFVLQTSGADLRIAQDAAAGSLLSQLVLGTFFLFAALLLVSADNAHTVLRRAWPVLALPLLAIASTTWSPDPPLTMRRAAAFAGTVVFGLSIASVYRFRDCARLICRGLAIAMILSVAMVMLDPRHGVHQADDAMQAVHAGAWRGIFAHRNTLGLWSGTTIAILVAAGREGHGWAPAWIIAMTAAVACLVNSGSSAGIAIAVLTTIFHCVLITIARQPRPVRGAALVVVLAFAVLAMMFFEKLAALGLSLLGREGNLTGRTLLWYYIIQMIQNLDRPLGIGYFVGLLTLDDQISELTQTRVVNAHNGYLESFIYFGYIGLFILLSVVSWLFLRSFRFLWDRAEQGHPPSLSTLPALFVFIAAMHNMIESTIVLPNNLNTLLISAAAAMLVTKVNDWREPAVNAASERPCGPME